MSIESIFQLGMKRTINNPLSGVGFGDVEINLGCGNSPLDGCLNYDYPEWDANTTPIVHGNNTVDVIHAYHFLEHCKDPVKMLLDCQRVLVPGGHMNIVVPYYTSQMACHDLDHKHFFTEETWKTLFNNPYYDKNEIEWKFKIHLNIIIGVVERNLCLMTQLVKE